MMKAYLQSQGIWLLVNGEEPSPDLPATPAAPAAGTTASPAASSSSSSTAAALLRETRKELIEWKNRDGKAIGSIALKIAPSLKIHIKDTAAETWAALKGAFGETTHGTTYHWVTKLLNFRLSGEIHPHKEFADLSQIHEQVKACKVNIDEYVIVLMILRNIPKRYESLASQIFSLGTLPEKMKITNLVEPIVAEYERTTKPSKALANRISAVKPKGNNPRYAQQKQAGQSQPHQPTPSTFQHHPQQQQHSNPPLQQSGASKKRKTRGGKQVKARQAIAMMQANKNPELSPWGPTAAYVGNVSIDPTDIPHIIPTLPPTLPPAQESHTILEFGKKGSASQRRVHANLPSHLHSAGATGVMMSDALYGKTASTPYSSLGKAREICDSLGEPKTAHNLRRLETLIIDKPDRFLSESADGSDSIEPGSFTPTGARKRSLSPSRSDDGCYRSAKKISPERSSMSDTEETRREDITMAEGDDDLSSLFGDDGLWESDIRAETPPEGFSLVENHPNFLERYQAHRNEPSSKSVKFCGHPFGEECWHEHQDYQEYVNGTYVPSLTLTNTELTKHIPQLRRAFLAPVGLDSRISAYIAADSNKSVVVSSFQCEICEKVKMGFQDWILDSGASHHMTNDLDDFAEYTETDAYGEVETAGSSESLQIKGTGTVFLHVQIKQKLRTIRLHPVLYIPKLSTRLMSLGVFLRDGHRLTGDIKLISLWRPRLKELSITARPRAFGQTIFWVHAHSSAQETLSVNKATIHLVDYNILHKRFGHPSKEVLRKAQDHTKSFPKGVEYPQHTPLCQGCALGKMPAASYPQSDTRATKPFEKIHTDLKQFPVKSYYQNEYMITFVDDYTSHAWTFFLKKKSDGFNAFKDFNALVRTQHDKSIKTLMSDFGGEFKSDEFHEYLRTNGIKTMSSVPRTPQQNGRAERFNRTVMDKAEAMRHDAWAPASWWEFAVGYATHVYNRTPIRRLKWRTPYESLNKEKPDISHLRVFGCGAWVYLTPEQRNNKLSPKSELMVFIGYHPGVKGYKFMRISNNRIHLATKAIFDETMFPKKPNGERRHFTPIGELYPSDDDEPNSGNGSESPAEDLWPDDDENHRPFSPKTFNQGRHQHHDNDVPDPDLESEPDDDALPLPPDPQQVPNAEERQQDQQPVL